MTPRRVAFVMEQALGHVTHYQNLRHFTQQQPDIDPVWVPIPFDLDGTDKFVPVFRNWSVRASWRARRALATASERGVPDALLFHTQVTSLFSVGLMHKVPSVVSLDATPINYDSLGAHYGHRAANGGFLDRKKFAMNRRAFHAAAGLVTWTDWARRSLIDDYGADAAKVRVIPPGAASVYFELGRMRSRSQAPRQSRPPRILFVGGDFQRKGGALLLDFMRQPSRPACELHLVTHAEIEPAPDVFIHKHLMANSPELLKLFEAADVFVLPTYADCLGVALMEAAAAGLPTIATPVGGVSEALVNGETGLVIPSGDPTALRDALLALLCDADKRRHMGAASFALARNRFDADRNNRSVLDFVLDHAAAPSEQAA